MYRLHALGTSVPVIDFPSEPFVVPCRKAFNMLNPLKLPDTGLAIAQTKRVSARRRSVAVSSKVQEDFDTLDRIGAGARSVRVHYYRKDQNYEGWGLHISGDPAIETSWNNPLKPKRDGNWVYWDLDLVESGRHVELIVHKGEAKSVTCRVSEWQLYDNKGLWMLAGEQAAYFQKPNVDSIAAGDLSKSYAHWLTKDVIGWREPLSDATGLRKFKLYWSKTASLEVASDGIHGEDGSVDLVVGSSGIPYEAKKKFPHLSSITALRLPSDLPLPITELLTYQLAVAMEDTSGHALDATGIQLAGVLDDLFTFDGPLGVSVGGKAEGVHIALWAPTAQSVALNIFETPFSDKSQSVTLSKGDSGVWEFKGPLSLVGQYYTYSVCVYCPWTQRIEVSESTDPYTRCCSADSGRTHIVDIDATHLKPEGWDTHTAPPLDKFTDISIYELHVRDFSCYDETVPGKLRGKYLAFAQHGSAGMNHLKKLADCGLTHIHLLPSYDFGSAPEREQDQLLPEGDLASYPPDSELQQAACLAVADRDAFNWGYDPVHYGTPEGSYSTDPDSAARVLEYRAMVKGLHDAGLRVVLDVVYNHTFQSGPQGKFSVLDKCVPGYYLRREENGDICMSTCCNNTASEHAMCERLIVEDIVHWAKNYKVDGFRFDIMGHLMCSTMDKIQSALSSLTLERDGVDGSKLYLYGEAWDFGEVAFNQRGRNASQLNIAGSGLGTFNDRFRDAAMGGGPFAPSKMQGIVTGLETEPNSFTQAEMSPPAQLDTLLWSADLLRLSMAAGLKDYVITDKSGTPKKGMEVSYHGSTPAAYALRPEEIVNYSSCHDNQTLFDQVMMKAGASADILARTRMCMLANSLTALGQGIPFFHAADELLRSKSLDRDSYNSGDWFNKIDWSYQTNNFGVGLPVASKNDYNWPIMKPLLGDTAMQPKPEHIALSRDHFFEMLQIRYSSPLFRLPTSSDVCSQLTFHNTGPQQVPAVIVLQLTSADILNMADGTVDPKYARILVVVNANVVPYTQDWPVGFSSLVLHPAQQQTVDPSVAESHVDAERKLVVVPPRTTCVFVEPRG